MTALAALLALAFAFALGYWSGKLSERRRPRQRLDLRSAGMIEELGRWQPFDPWVAPAEQLSRPRPIQK